MTFIFFVCFSPSSLILTNYFLPVNRALWISVAYAMNEQLVKLGFVPFFAQQLSDLSVLERPLQKSGVTG